MWSILFVGIMLVFIIGALVVASLKRSRTFSFRRPRKRHIVTRIICGALGFGILVALSLGTRRELRRGYEFDEDIKVHAPTRPAPPVAGEGDIEINRGRFLIQLVVADLSAGFFPVYAREAEVKWPEDRGREIEGRLDLHGVGLKYSLRLDAFYAKCAPAGKSPSFQTAGRVSFSSKSSFGSHSSAWAGYDFGESVFDLSPARPSNHPLSVMSPASLNLKAMFFATPVAEDDPLREVSLDELSASWAGKINGVGRGPDSSIRLDAAEKTPLRGFMLAQHIGLASLLLLGAAIFLTQLFVRRDLVFVAIVAMLVLYVAALDRAVLESHLTRATDARLSVRTRRMACSQTRSAFFFRKTARLRLEALSRDSSAPEPLRHYAKVMTHPR